MVGGQTIISRSRATFSQWIVGQYDDGTYWEYLSWYCSCTCATLLSGNVPPAPKPFPEDRARLLHVVVSDVVLITIFISFSVLLT